uniref:Cytochrome C oxidase n=1 Tax=uncultured bacterium AR_456 TaxID=1630014 RepID=A0A0E3M1R7_9BACT|nr:cytochrome C oxidase [uncultured bacterium AR_456]
MRQHADPRGWSAWRTTGFLLGAGLLVLALLPAASPYPAGDPRGHMLQHLLIGMFAPIGLALGAPVTLLLRTVPPRWGRAVGRVLRGRPAHALTHPVSVLVLNVGGLLAVYASPLAGVVAEPVTHLHFLVSGYLFAWVVAGPDPAPRRPSVPVRLVLLGVAIATHAVLSQLMYAGVLPGPAAPPDQVRGAAELMYYGGDIAELLLAFAMLTARGANTVGHAGTRLSAAAGRS